MLRLLMRILLGIGAAIAVLLFSFFFLLRVLFEPSHDEVARIASPDGKAAAVLYEVNGGATTSFAYEVRLEPGTFGMGSRRVAWLYDARRSNLAYGVNLRWEKPAELQVEFLQAQSTKLNGPSWIWGAPDIQVVLRSGVADNEAPAGGMLVNRLKLK